MITLNLVGKQKRSFRYKTLKGAKRKAHQLVGPNPRRDPDGYAVSRENGDCLFVIGVPWEAIWSCRACEGDDVEHTCDSPPV